MTHFTLTLILLFFAAKTYHSFRQPVKLETGSSRARRVVLRSEKSLEGAFTPPPAKVNLTVLREKAEPLLSKNFIISVIRQWTTELPRVYLNRPLIVTGPSGAGKGRLISELRKDYLKYFHKIVTYTTRTQRKKEIEGKHYHFISEEEFERFNRSNFFLETARVHNHSYGVSYYSWYLATRNIPALNRIKKEQRDLLYFEAGPFEQEAVKIPLLELDQQGVQFFRGKEASLRIRPNYVFVQPPSLNHLEERLLERGAGEMSEQERELRLNNAVKDLAYLEQHRAIFRKVIVNEELGLASNELFRCVRDW